ncbi:MAG: GNAT family N-acetyltransferase [Rickettsiales bacterium]|jgi:ribosomal-protein-alanine N-acetyltransferase|nr:GNAT family N-acetyltransferase [Rickettsiales bacterium]
MTRPIEFAAEMHAECFPNKPWTVQDFEGLEKSGARIVASDDGFIVWRVVGDDAEIITIGVRPNARRRGVAIAMIAAMEKELSKKGVSKIFLEVAVDNIAAIKLYEKNAFVRVGRRPKYYDGIDGVIMEKRIS